MKQRDQRLGVAAIVVTLAIAVGLIISAPRLARRIGFFRVRQVEVVGAHFLNEVDVAHRLGIAAGASTFDQLASVRRAAAAIPGVLSASVERILPSTLRITLVEAQPVAVTTLDDHLVPIDSAGRVLPFDLTRAPASLPIADRDRAVAGLLSRLRRADSAFYDTIEAAQLDRGTIVLDVGRQRIRLAANADRAVLRSVTAVLGYLRTNAVAWREIDARYRGRVFVEKGSA
jgi:POTRA domain-containing FtsQ-type protein